LDTARKKLSEAIVNGKAIRVEGGACKMVRLRSGRFRVGTGGRERMGGPLVAGPEGYCICPKCKNKVQHQAGVPCHQMTCPECGTKL